ncbi:hypothetical protein SDC9_87878 [bioreactor metagenome]|uniref:Uncharacterized protein n=1 Tax=bioreactor metagenome TaxID=1076179 RepID=A0A644ZLK1_9ZZZZ
MESRLGSLAGADGRHPDRPGARQSRGQRPRRHRRNRSPDHAHRQCDGRSGGDVRPVGDRDGSHQHTVGTDEGTGADMRCLLGLPVIVRDDGTGTQRGSGADLDIRRVRLVGDRRACPDHRALRLDERAEPDVLGELGAGTQVGERPDLAAGPDGGEQPLGAADRRPLADLDVLQRGVRPDHCTGGDRGRPEQLGAGQQGDVGGDVDGVLDPGGGRVDDGDTGEHPLLPDPPVHLGAHPGQLEAVVDPLGLPQVLGDVRPDAAPDGVGVGDHIGEVELALRVVGAETGQAVVQDVGVEDVDAGVDLGDRPLRLRGVLVLDDAGDPGVAAADDPAVAGRVGHVRGQHGDRVPGAAVVLDHGAQRLAAEQGDVAVRDDDDAADLPQRRQAAHHRVTGALLLLLHRGQHRRGDLAQVRLDLFALVAHHDDQVLRRHLFGGVDRPGQHRAAGDLVQHLGPGRLHPGPGTGGEHHDSAHTSACRCVRRHVVTRGHRRLLGQGLLSRHAPR